MSKSNSELLLARRKNAIANGVGVFNTTTVRTSKGATIIDLDGRELIDFTGGIGVIIAGNSTPNMKVAAKEVFGPLVVLEKADSFEEAIRMTNDFKYGLQVSVFMNSLKNFKLASDELVVGGVIIKKHSWY